jgi:hypothetical protein
MRPLVMNRLMQHLYQSLQQLWPRLLSLLRRGRYEREVEEEMRFHLETQIEQINGFAESFGQLSLFRNSDVFECGVKTEKND